MGRTAVRSSPARRRPLKTEVSSEQEIAEIFDSTVTALTRTCTCTILIADEFLEYAFGIISEYLPVSLSVDLKTELGFVNLLIGWEHKILKADEHDSGY